MGDVAAAVAGRSIAWEPVERMTLPDDNFGVGDCFSARRRGQACALALSLASDGMGNPRDGSGYHTELSLELDTPEGLIRIRHGQGSSTVAMRWLALELETAPPEKRRAVFAAARSALFASLARRGMAASDETPSPMRCFLNVSLVGHTDPSWAIALADEGLALCVAAAREDGASVARLIELRARLGPAPDLLSLRLALAPVSLDAWRSALDEPPAGVKRKQIVRAIARLTPYDRAAVQRAPLAKVATVWLDHPLWGGERWTELADARASDLAAMPKAPADSGWLHAEDGAGILERVPAAHAITRALLPGLAEGDRDGARLAEGIEQSIRRHATRKGESVLVRVEIEQAREGEKRSWSLLFGPGPIDALVVFQLFFSSQGCQGDLLRSPPWIVRALGSKTWVAKAIAEAGRAAPRGLHPGGALPNLAEAEPVE